MVTDAEQEAGAVAFWQGEHLDSDDDQNAVSKEEKNGRIRGDDTNYKSYDLMKFSQ